MAHGLYGEFRIVEMLLHVCRSLIGKLLIDGGNLRLTDLHVELPLVIDLFVS